MNIFDNLVNELKEEHLLEETVIEDEDKKVEFKESAKETLKRDLSENVKNVSPEKPESVKDQNPPQASPKRRSKNKENPTGKDKKNKFFRKRAAKEVSFLQMVELVLSGVEREQLKVVPRPFDDLKVKKALHEYIKISKKNDLSRQAKFEFQLLQETQSWYSALSHRDKRVSVAHLRRFCETTRPPLSAPALVSISRFYRNAPFSESVRNKFDLIITRVFSKDLDGERRELVFTRDELIDHITGLYTEWESVPMYPTDEEDSEILLLVVKFDEFMYEAARAETFDDLVSNDFFNRLRAFKKSTNENFYAPSVTAAAIECNIRIGNRYVDLIDRERKKTSSKLRDEKYGLIIDQVVSDVTSKTLQLVDLLDEKGAHSKGWTKKAGKGKKSAKLNGSGILQALTKISKNTSLFKINKWLLVLAGVTIVFTFGLYGWVEFSDSGPVQTGTVQQLNLEGSDLGGFVKVPRISNGVLYGVVMENWETLSREERENVLMKASAFGKKNGVSKVHFFNKGGRTVGTADGERVFVRELE